MLAEEIQKVICIGSGKIFDTKVIDAETKFCYGHGWYLWGASWFTRCLYARSAANVALQAGGSPSRDIKRSMSNKALESSCLLVKASAVTSNRSIHMKDRTRPSIILWAWEREGKDGAATLKYSTADW